MNNNTCTTVKLSSNKLMPVFPNVVSVYTTVTTAKKTVTMECVRVRDVMAMIEVEMA